MERTVRAVFVCGALWIGSAGMAWAHHSFAAAYDLDDPVSVDGTIVQVRLTNPHSFFFLDVTNEAGEVERWAFEAGTPGGMLRNGYDPDTIKPGTRVVVRGFRAYDDDERAGMLRELELADGTVYGMFGPREGSGTR
jgi:hypothetical protein